MYEDARRKLLIIDHKRLLRQLLKEALLSRFPGLEVVEAENVSGGYQYAKELRPELVLLEIELPDGNGLELARRFRDELPEVMVCICTIYDYPEYRQAAAEVGAAHFISKQDRFWSDTENLVKARFQFTGCAWGMWEDGGISRNATQGIGVTLQKRA
jgi:DNA-binding NarL/FixJ family response regulator